MYFTLSEYRVRKYLFSRRRHSICTDRGNLTASFSQTMPTSIIPRAANATSARTRPISAEPHASGIRRLLGRASGVGVAALLALFGTAGPAQAITLSFLDIYAETLTATGVTTGQSILHTPESGTLAPTTFGTLEDIELLFSGTITFTVTTGLNVFTTGGIVQNVPYTISPRLSIGIDGLPDLYDMEPLSFTTTVPATGFGETLSVTGSYSFRFSYLDFLDSFIGPQNVSASGGALLPPVVLSGRLEDFDAGQAFSDQLLIRYDLGFTEAPRVTAVPTIVTATSVLQVLTRYTFADPPVAVSEPATGCLLVAGLAAVAALRRRRTLLSA